MHFSASLFALLFILCCMNEADTIKTTFQFPSPLRKWPLGERFAKRTINLGGLLVKQVTTFKKIWETNEGGSNNNGTTFYEPIGIPRGFSCLGFFAQPSNIPLYGHVFVGKDVSNNTSKPTLRSPIDYHLRWSSESLNITKHGECYIWLPIAPHGYKAIGYVITGSSEKPPLNKISCVHADLIEPTKKPVADATKFYFENKSVIKLNGLNVYASMGGFTIGDEILGNLYDKTMNSMLNWQQIRRLIRVYSPVIYFHPEEKYLPSSVEWFFQNGVLLHHKGDKSNPEPIQINGSNLPQGSSEDKTYWLDLPSDKSSKDRVKKGNLQDACAYIHVKPASGGLYTDVAFWVFYPFNGRTVFEVFSTPIVLLYVGEHVGDWEHVTVRFRNIDGMLDSIYFSIHGWGQRISPSALDWGDNEKPIVYVSIFSHASYSKPGVHISTNKGISPIDIGIRDEAAQSNITMDTGIGYVLVAADHVEKVVVEPPWLNYFGKWGPGNGAFGPKAKSSWMEDE